MFKPLRPHLLLLFLVTGCIEPYDGAPPPGDLDVRGDPGPCARTLAPADRTRYAVASHPYDSAGNPAATFEVLELSTNGTLGSTGHTFETGYATEGVVQFTPDGEIGLIAHHGNEGTLGVFRLAADGTPTVIHAQYDGANGDLWVSGVVVHPDGNRALVIDGNFQNNGGGLYEVAIGCDGTITEKGLLIETKLAQAVYFLPADPDRIVVVAKEVGPEGASPAGDDVHLLDISGTATWLAGADLFPDNDYWASATALTPDGRYVLVADDSTWSGLPHRIAVAEILQNDIVWTQTISPLPFDNPGGLAASPYNNAILLLTWGYPNDGATWFAFDPNSTTPVGADSEVNYRHGLPELPGSAVVITRGPLTGRMLINENVKVRQMQFLFSGGVADVDALDYGTGEDTLPDAMVGAIGIQP